MVYLNTSWGECELGQLLPEPDLVALRLVHFKRHCLCFAVDASWHLAQRLDPVQRIPLHRVAFAHLEFRDVNL